MEKLAIPITVKFDFIWVAVFLLIRLLILILILRIGTKCSNEWHACYDSSYSVFLFQVQLSTSSKDRNFCLEKNMLFSSWDLNISLWKRPLQLWSHFIFLITVLKISTALTRISYVQVHSWGKWCTLSSWHL